MLIIEIETINYLSMVIGLMYLSGYFKGEDNLWLRL